eukprot:TRINITY_DN7015_c0_g2_i1.p1 TRINITY_DN7015_c0_g2~~TRINITY_DN7015_c0_g2_i1.p1  ORF type:complete len:476 (+),score=132.31 TRINITY_DN7015_c0_g2_i1:44-1471(+)
MLLRTPLTAGIRSALALRFMSGMEVKFPAMSPTMTEGRIVNWRKKEGEKVSPGDALFEIQTDKATLDVEATEEGYLAKIIMHAGDAVIKVGESVAVMVDAPGDIANVKLPEKKEASQPSAPTAANPPISSAPQTQAPAKVQHQAVDVSNVAFPSVKRLLSLYNVDPSSIKPTGPAGRLTKGDVLQYVAAKKLTALTPEQLIASAKSHSAKSVANPETSPPKSAQSPSPSSAPAPPRREQIVTETKLVSSAAARLKKDVPHVAASVECNYDELLETQKAINDLLDGEKTIPLEAFIVKAVGLALRQVPEMNVHFDAASDSWTQRNSSCDVALQFVDKHEAPLAFVKKADQTDLSKITSTLQAPQPTETAAPVSVSFYDNLDVHHTEPIVNGPSVASVSVGSPYTVVESFATESPAENDDDLFDERPRLVSSDGIKVANKVQLTLSWDARLVDESTASRFLDAVKQFVQSPSTMILK